MNQITIKTLTQLAVIFAAIPTLAVAGTFNREVIREFDAADIQKFSLNAGAAKVDVKGSDQSQIIVKIEMTTKADDETEASEAFEKMEIKFDEDTNEISVSVRPKRGGGFFSWLGIKNSKVKSQISVLVPETMDLDLNTGSGAIDVQNVDGTLALDNGSGQISGTGLSGSISADSGSGGVKLSNIKGSVNADTGSGNISLVDLVGNFTADTGSGDIDVAGQISKFAAGTGSGSITITSNVALTDDSAAATGSGSIRVNLPAQAGFDLTVGVGIGSIDCGFALQDEARGKHSLKGSANGSGPDLVFGTGSGSVSLMPIP